MGRLKRFSKKLLLALFGLLIGCFIAEIALRINGYSYPYFYITDYYTGYSPRPNVQGWFWVENKNYIQINSDGLRDQEHSKAKPADTIRIAVLGDSFAEAREVPMEQAFWAVMGKQLQACQAFAGKKIEVINFGVAGYGTAQELITLRQRVWDYSPDIVLLAVTPYNDVMDNYLPLRGAKGVPYFIYQDGRLVHDASFRNSSSYRRTDSNLFGFWMWLHNHSRLIQLLHHAQEGLRRGISSWKEQRSISQLQQTQDRASQTQPVPDRAVLGKLVGKNNLVYLEPTDIDWNEAWRITEGLIVQTRDDVRQKGAKFLVVAISSDIQVHADKSARQAFMQRLGVENLFYPNLRLQNLAEREGILFLDLAQPMQIYADQNRVFLHGFGKDFGGAHWNPTGHSLAGHLIAQKLCQGASN